MSLTTYPIRVESQSFDHQGGTKSYHLMMISNVHGKAIVINRWGKKGQFGEIKVVSYDSVAKAETDWNKKEREKVGKGYRPTAGVTERVATEASELAKTIGIAMFNKIGSSAINHIDPDFDTSRMREAEPARLDEDGRLNGVDTTRKADLSALMEQQRLEEERAAQAAYDSNPLFGAF